MISFAEAAELAYFGAKVLHPATVLPAIEQEYSGADSEFAAAGGGGHAHRRRTPFTAVTFKSIACKKNVTLVNIHSTRMLMAHGFLRSIFEIFDRHETPVDMVATSEVSVSLTIDNAAQHGRDSCGNCSEFAEVSMEDGQAIVCLVGENIRYTPGVAARVFGSGRH